MRKDGTLFWAASTISPMKEADGRISRYIAVEEDITEKVEAQNVLLRESRKFPQFLQAASQVSIIATDPKGVITLFNEGARNLLGYEPGEVVGLASALLFHKAPEVILRGRELGEETGRTVGGFEVITTIPLRNGSETREWTYVRKDGSEFQVSLVVTGIHDSCGEITGFLGIGTDLSRARIAREALEKSQELLEEGDLGAGVGGWELSLPEMTLSWTDQACLIHEVEPGYIPTLESFLAFYAPGSRSVIENAIQEARIGRTPWDLELRFVTAKGRQLWVRVTGRPKVLEGRITHLFGTIQDITARKLTDLKLADEQSRLAKVIAGADMGTWEWNVQTGETIFNERWAGICGYTLEEISPCSVETWLNLLHPEDQPGCQELLMQHFRGEIPHYDTEFRMRHKNGDWVWIRASGSLISHTPEGLPLLMYGVHLDITAEKRKEDALKEANRMLQESAIRAESGIRAKSAFLATMSHEIRTPLNAIIGMSELLEHYSIPKEARELIESIHTGGDTLLSLVNNILDFSKIDADQLVLEELPLDLSACAETSLRMVSLQAEKKGLFLRLTLDPSLPEAVMGDGIRLQQVLMNLLMNAVKFTEKGEVDLKISRRNGNESHEEIEFEVTDSGIGIAPEDQEKIFHSFTQVDSTISRRYGGSGLGLAISQRLVSLMGGSIEVKSSPGAGATFSFTIPLRAAQMPKESEKPVSPVPDSDFRLGEQCPLKILVAEDNIINQRIVRMMLERMGYAPVVVANGIEVLRELKNSRYDLILMDVQMPGMNGMEAAAKIREIYPPEVRPRIIALTANPMNGGSMAFLEAGMDDSLEKPLRIKRLAEVLRNVYRITRKEPPVFKPASNGSRGHR